MQQAETIVPLTDSQSDGAAADSIGNGIIAMLKHTAQVARENADRAVRTSQRWLNNSNNLKRRYVALRKS